MHRIARDPLEHRVEWRVERTVNGRQSLVRGEASPARVQFLAELREKARRQRLTSVAPVPSVHDH